MVWALGMTWQGQRWARKGRHPGYVFVNSWTGERTGQKYLHMTFHSQHLPRSGFSVSEWWEVSAEKNERENRWEHCFFPSISPSISPSFSSFLSPLLGRLLLHNYVAVDESGVRLSSLLPSHPSYLDIKHVSSLSSVRQLLFKADRTPTNDHKSIVISSFLNCQGQNDHGFKINCLPLLVWAIIYYLLLLYFTVFALQSEFTTRRWRAIPDQYTGFKSKEIRVLPTLP